MSDPAAAPLYRQISELLTRRIAGGQLIEGERLPPERDMAGEYGVSVGTLRKALADLADKGLLERRQGSGNYIRKMRDLGGLYGFFRIELIEGGGLPSALVIDAQRLEKPADLPVFGPSDHAHRIRRLRHLGDIPAVLEEIWLDASWADDLPAEGLEGALYHHYRTRLGLRITRVEDRVGVGAVPDWPGARLGLAPGQPCGFVERLGWAQTGARAEFSRSWFDHEKCRHVSRLV